MLATVGDAVGLGSFNLGADVAVETKDQGDNDDDDDDFYASMFDDEEGTSVYWSDGVTVERHRGANGKWIYSTSHE